MTYSVLLLGATGVIGSKIAAKLTKYQSQLKRVAFLTPLARISPDKESKYQSVPIPRVTGHYDDPATYKGFDIVIFALAHSLSVEQIKYFNAAFAGGVKHIYPTEFGFDLTRELVTREPSFSHKIQARKALEERVAKDETLGYTYLMNGMFSEWILDYDTLGLSNDKKSAQFLGTSDALLTTTPTEDIAEFLALSLLPTHLKSLSERRELRVAGTTLPVSDYFETVAQFLGHGIDVQYLSRESSYEYEKEQVALGNELQARFTPIRRVLGFGGSEMQDPDNKDYPEFKPESWEQVVKRMLA